MNFFTSSKAVWDYVETFKHQSQRPLVNGFVLQMYVDLSKNASKTVQKLNELFNVSDNSSTRISVAHIYKHVFNLKKNLTVNNSAKLVEFINSRFIADCPQKESKKCTTIPSSSSSSVDLVAVTVVDNINNNNNNNTSTSSSVETRAVCAQCSQLKKTYAKQSAVLKKKCRLAKQEWKNVARLYGVRRINQCKKRVASTIKDLREKCAQLRKENRSLRVQVGGSKSVIKCENKCLKRKLSSMEGIVDEKARVAKTLRKEVCALRCELECSEMEVIQEEAKLEEEKRCRIFSDPLRKCVYYCLMFNVPIEATSKVIQYLGACLGSDVKYVPHPSTVARCAYELGVLCDVQTAEFMLQAESLTLAWDATTLKGDHINQVIITSESGVMVLTTDVLAGGTGDDYAEHLVNSICHIAAVHSRFQCSDYTAVLNSIVRKFRCTMTDRASVNHCAAVRLMNQLQISLLELNCQLHPLECFASATREALLTHEKAAGSTRSKTFGQTAGAVNVIAAISKLRYKDGKGDPTGFKSFLKAEGIDGRLLIRYVGNRLHAVFHLGASIFFLKEKLLTYLKRCSQQALRLAVIDLNVNVDKFALKRVIEIQALTDVIKDVGGNHQAFQKLPHYMRRRPMSHNIKRVPRRLHDVVKAELDKVKTPSKRPSRKYRRKPSNLLSEYERRKRRICWLDTHIWHAKRFKMIEAWGYRLPYHPSDKSIRSCYRSVQRHCLLQDVSYEQYIEVEGKREDILSRLCHLTAKETGPSFAAQMTSSGSKEGSLYLYHYDSYPHNVIGRVTFFWHANSQLDDGQESSLTLWICCHPSFGPEAHEEITKCFNKQSIKHENDATDDDFIKVESDEGKCNEVRVTSLKHELVKFRLFGPASNSVLRESLKLWERSELDIEDSDTKIMSSREDDVVPLPEQEIKQGKESFSNECHWWKPYYQNSLRQEENEKQKEVLTRVLGCRSPAEAPPHIIMAATVRDPRLLLPPKRNKVSVFYTETAMEHLKTEMFTKEVSTSPLWRKDVRENVKSTKVLEKALNDMKSKQLIPGTKLMLGERESRIPVILVQRPGLTDFTYSTGPNGLSSQHQIGYASGWDIIMPAGWAMAFWLAMVYRGARVGGQREAKSIALQAKQFIGVRDVPDSNAGKKVLENEAAVLQCKHDKRPPAKRPNYTKLGFDSPFVFPFDQLCKEWCKGDLPKTTTRIPTPSIAVKESLYVLRQRKILRMLNTVLTDPKRFLQSSKNKRDKKDTSSSLLEKILMMEEGKCLVESHSSALIPVSLSVFQRGVPTRNAHICIPSDEDWSRLKRDKHYGGPEEKLHPDEDSPRRKAERKERLKLRKKKKTGKKSGTARVCKSAIQVDHEKKDAVSIVDGSNSAKEVVDSSNSCKFSISKTSRSVVGFVTVGDFDLGLGQGAGMGFCSAMGLLHLINAWQRKEGAFLVLVRNSTSCQYRFASMSIVLC